MSDLLLLKKYTQFIVNFAPE